MKCEECGKDTLEEDKRQSGIEYFCTHCQNFYDKDKVFCCEDGGVFLDDKFLSDFIIKRVMALLVFIWVGVFSFGMFEVLVKTSYPLTVFYKGVLGPSVLFIILVIFEYIYKRKKGVFTK